MNRRHALLNIIQVRPWDAPLGVAILIEDWGYVSRELRREAGEIVEAALSSAQHGGGVGIVEAVRGSALVHIDMSGAQSWDEIVNAAREAVEECYRQARSDQSFGVAVFIDEVHNFVP